MRHHAMEHSHPCAIPGCRESVSCSGTWERNHDGLPEAICSDFHLPGGEIAVVYCDEHTEYDPTPWELPGDPAGPRCDAIHREDEARRVKR